MSEALEGGLLNRAFLLNGRLRAIWRFFLSLFAIWICVNLAFFMCSGFGRGRLFEASFRCCATVLIVASYFLLLKIADRIEQDTFAAMGLPFRKPWLRDGVVGAAIGFGLVTVAYIVIRSTCEVTRRVNVNGRTWKVLLLDVAMLMWAAMFEEVMFRGYPFQRLAETFGGICRRMFRGWADNDGGDKIGAFTAAVFWSAAFGAVHIGNPDASVWSFLNTALVGVLFCVAYLRTRSLWMPWGIHFAWNTTLGLVFGLPVSGLTMFSVVVRSEVKGPAWITGGSYGIEASALGTAVIVVGIVVVLTFVKQRPPIAAGIKDRECAGNESMPLSIQP